MQDTFWEHNPDHNFTKAVSQIDCLKDSDKLKKLSKKQGQQVWQSLRILELVATWDCLHAEIVTEFNIVKMAVRELIYKNYQILR